MDQDTIDRIRLEERARFLAVASDEVSKLLKELSIQKAATQDAKTTSNQSTPVQKSSNQSTPVQKSSNQGTPVHKSSNQSTPVRKSSNQSTPVQKSSNQSTPVQKSSNQSTPVQKSSSNQSLPVKKTPKQSTKGPNKGPPWKSKPGKNNQNVRGSQSLSSLNSGYTGQPNCGGSAGQNQGNSVMGFPPSYEESVHLPNVFQPIDMATNAYHQFHPNYSTLPQHLGFANPNGPAYAPQAFTRPPLLRFPIHMQQSRPIRPTGPPPSKSSNGAKSALPKKDTCAKKSVPEKLSAALLVKELVNCPEFFSNVESLSKKMDHHQNSILELIKQNANFFSIMEDKSCNKVFVELCPAIKMCKDHLGLSGCLASKCPHIHICPVYVVGTCRDKDCPYGHFWKSNQNRSIFSAFELDDIPLNILHKLAQKVFKGTISPKICSFYKDQCCNRGTQCEYLHICPSYVETLGNCPEKENCPFNHNIREAKCKAIMERFGICTNESPRDLLKVLAEKCKEKEVSESETEASENEMKASESETKAKKKNRKKKKATKPETAEQPKDKESGPAKVPETIGTVFSNHFRGNIDSPYICPKGIEGKCSFVDNRCKFLHSKTSYYWQYATSESKQKWFNFHVSHSDMLEKLYRDVACTGGILPPLDPKVIESSMKGIMTLLGKNSLKADFLTMTIDCEGYDKTYPIRHITTISSVISKDKYSTPFSWYFEDDQGKWQLFGRGNSSSSADIETLYQMDMTGSAVIPFAPFHYKIDFSSMTQKNTSTHKVRPIRRRPAPSQGNGDIFPSTTSSSSDKSSLQGSPSISNSDKSSLQGSPSISNSDMSSLPVLKLPSTWEAMDDGEDYKLVKLSSMCEEFKEMRQLVLTTLPMSNILSISRLQNARLWKQFIKRQESLKKKYQTDFLNIPQLFCGIEHDRLTDVGKDNLDWPSPNQNAPTHLGSGLYFYLSAAAGIRDATPDFLGVKNLIITDVILGKVTQGSAGLTRPPINPSTNLLYDTTTDQVTSPSVFVKFCKRDIYPSYVVQLN